jgi:hypothetical protein
MLPCTLTSAVPCLRCTALPAPALCHGVQYLPQQGMHRVRLPKQVPRKCQLQMQALKLPDQHAARTRCCDNLMPPMRCKTPAGFWRGLTNEGQGLTECFHWQRNVYGWLAAPHLAGSTECFGVQYWGSCTANSAGNCTGMQRGTLLWEPCSVLGNWATLLSAGTCLDSAPTAGAQSMGQTCSFNIQHGASCTPVWYH